jgi:hypothetical protein
MAQIGDLLGQELGGKRHENNGELLDTLYENVEARAIVAIRWYMNERRGRSRLSKLVRIATLLFVVCGTLVPLLETTAARAKWPALDISSWGYVFFTLAGGLVLLDKYFGLSSSWMRFLSAGLALQRELRRFQLDWASRIALLNGADPTLEETKQLLGVLQRFSESVEAEILKETNAWIAEFRSGLSEFEQLAKKGPDSAVRSDARLDAELRRGPAADGSGAIAISGGHGAGLAPAAVSLGMVDHGPRRPGAAASSSPRTSDIQPMAAAANEGALGSRPSGKGA